ncbi:MAG: hypothetical protein U0263_27825 [Polyangiaceae bacterium]
MASRISSVTKLLGPWAPWGLVAAVLGVIATRTILATTGGEVAVPLDDTFIHLQFARSFSRGEPLVYTPGTPPTPGATSLLWPLVLSPFVKMGETAPIWVAWFLGFLALSLLALETQRLAAGLTSSPVAFATGAMVPAFGGLVWCAGSGMEVVPLAWLLVLSARLGSEWLEGESAPSRRALAALLVVAFAAPLMRPEGALGSVIVAIAIALSSRGRGRLWALVALLAPLAGPLFNHWVSGQSTTTTALSKWLPLNPYHQGERLWPTVSANIVLLFGTLFDGRIWSAIFIPAGARYVAWIAPLGLVYVALRKNRSARGSFVLILALGMLIPASFDCMLCNRLRYLWPFAPAWFVCLGALAESVGLLLSRYRQGLIHMGLALSAGMAGAFGATLSRSIDDLAESADAIRKQQTSLGRWAKEKLPADARIGVNDTGAIAYFSGRRTFDVVGLTTKSEPRYWAAGAGSRFEHYERMPRAELPTHFIVYPEWMNVPQVLGTELTERTVRASILGGATMVAYEASYELLGSAERPLDAKGEPIDRLDVADLESEAAHAYELFWATQIENRIFDSWAGAERRADGGRSGRTLERFSLAIEPKARFVARLAVEESMSIELRVDGRVLKSLEATPGDEWLELAVELPADAPRGRARFELLAPEGKSFAALHYWAEPAAARTPSP